MTPPTISPVAPRSGDEWGVRERHKWTNRALKVEEALAAARAEIAAKDVEIERLQQSILDAGDEITDRCSFCGKDTRPQKDCRSCNIDHGGRSLCFRDGKHADDCVWLEVANVLKGGRK